MASAVIHLCVAKKVNEKLKMDEKMIALGSIAPDISKQIGQTKVVSHFLDGQNEDEIPNIDRFVKKYRNELNKPFEMGYLIHLLTDKYWFRDYVYNYISRYENKEGVSELTYTGIKNLIYNDYTNLNINLITKYEPEIDIFMNEITYPESIITEIPIEDLPVIVEKMGLIIMESKQNKTIVFNMNDIEKFVEECTINVLKDIEEILSK